MTKIPFVSKEKVEEIAAKYPTPFHLYDEKGIRKNVENLKKAFSWNKGYKEYFAVKATPNPFLINIKCCITLTPPEVLPAEPPKNIIPKKSTTKKGVHKV